MSEVRRPTDSPSDYFGSGNTSKADLAKLLALPDDPKPLASIRARPASSRPAAPVDIGPAVDRTDKETVAPRKCWWQFWR